MTDIKQEVLALLQLSPKYHTDHAPLKLVVGDLSDEVAEAVAAAHAKLIEEFKPVRALGFELRAFADAQVEFVLNAIKEAEKPKVVEVPVVTKPKKVRVIEPTPMPEIVVEEPVPEVKVSGEPTVDEQTE